MLVVFLIKIQWLSWIFRLKIIKLIFFALSEPKINGQKANEVLRKFNFFSLIQKRGNWNEWRKHDLLASRKISSLHFGIQTPIYLYPWLIACIYWNTNANNGNFFWEEIESIATRVIKPWMITRDFNAITCCNESTTTSSEKPANCYKFSKLGLIDLGFISTPFI